MMESGEVIVVTPGLEDGDNKGSEESFVNNLEGKHLRKPLKCHQGQNFEAIVKVGSPTSANTLLVANIDPKLKLSPQVMIDFVMNTCVGF